jgi:hypothetical protein
MVRDEDEAIAAAAHQLEAKAAELEARRTARRLVDRQDTTRRRDEKARRALGRLDEVARWRGQLDTRARHLREGREWSQRPLTSVLKATFRLTLVLWLIAAVFRGSGGVGAGLAPLLALWLAVVVEVRR